MSSLKEFSGLTAVVTGGRSGLGLAIARELALRGASTWVLDLDDSPVEAPLKVARCDVRSDLEVREAIDFIVEAEGRIDVVVANAGVGAQGTIEDNDDSEWRNVSEINVFGAARVARASMRHLRNSAVGSLTFTTSIAGTIGLQDRALYSATKGALEALTRAIAADSVAMGVRVNAVAPGTADTPWIGRLLDSASDPAAERSALERRQPTGRLVKPQEVADAVAYLASPRSGSTTGVTLHVDGGLHSVRTRPGV